MTGAEFDTNVDYVLPMAEVRDAGYISVLALESEIHRRKTCRKDRKYNPNITSKCGIEHLYQKDVPLFLSTIPKDLHLPCKHRSPAPLPRDPTLLAGKIQGDVTKPVPAIHVDKGAEKGPATELDKDGIDLNNNTDVDSLEKENFSGESADCKYTLISTWLFFRYNLKAKHTRTTRTPLTKRTTCCSIVANTLQFSRSSTVPEYKINIHLWLCVLSVSRAKRNI